MGYNPYAKGRWYRAFIESDGSNYKITNSDFPDATMSGSNFVLPKDFHVIDYLVDFDRTTVDNATNYSKNNRIYADGTNGVSCPPVDSFTHLYLYIFGYQE